MLCTHQHKVHMTWVLGYRIFVLGRNCLKKIVDYCTSLVIVFRENRPNFYHYRLQYFETSQSLICKFYGKFLTFFTFLVKIPQQNSCSIQNHLVKKTLISLMSRMYVYKCAWVRYEIDFS